MISCKCGPSHSSPRLKRLREWINIMGCCSCWHKSYRVWNYNSNIILNGFNQKWNYNKLLPRLCCSFINLFIVVFKYIYKNIIIPIIFLFLFEFYRSTVLITREGSELQPFPEIKWLKELRFFWQYVSASNFQKQSLEVFYKKRCS